MCLVYASSQKVLMPVIELLVWFMVCINLFLDTSKTISLCLKPMATNHCIPLFWLVNMNVVLKCKFVPVACIGLLNQALLLIGIIRAGRTQPNIPVHVQMSGYKIFLKYRRALLIHWSFLSTSKSIYFQTKPMYLLLKERLLSFREVPVLLILLMRYILISATPVFRLELINAWCQYKRYCIPDKLLKSSPPVKRDHFLNGSIMLIRLELVSQFVPICVIKHKTMQSNLGEAC